MPEDPDNKAQPASNPLDFEPPSLDDLSAALDGFEVQAFLGKGALGTVYKAVQPKLDRLVALKIFPASVASESTFAARFRREAQTMAKMRHDHIMSVHDFGESIDGKWLYIAMEWVEGDTLERALLQQNFDQARILAVAAQLCDALRYAHDHGVVHRDLKPGNIMLADEGRIKVADFGMAHIVGQESHDNKLTHSTAAIGMPDFVAPEQLEPGSPVDHRADVYSVGVILYKMLTGTIPRGTYRPPSERTPGLDPRLDAVVARAMEPDPDRRYQQVGEMIEELLEIHSAPAQAAAPAPKLVTGRVTERADAPKLVTGRVTEKATPATAATEAAPEANVPSEKKVAVAVMAIVGTVVLVLAIVAGVLFFNKETPPAAEPIIASVPQPKKTAPKPAPPKPSSVAPGKALAGRPDRQETPTTPQTPGSPVTPTATTLAPGQSLDLIAYANPVTDKINGIWVRTSSGLANRNTEGQAKLVLPARPSGDYRLKASFTRTKGGNSFGFHLPLNKNREVSCFFDHIGSGGADASGLEYVDGLDLFNPENPTRVFPAKLEDGRRYETEVTVRFPGNDVVTIDVLLDGKPYFNFEGVGSRLSIFKGWSQKPNNQGAALGLAVSNSACTVHELEVEVLSGELALSRKPPSAAIAGTAAPVPTATKPAPSEPAPDPKPESEPAAEPAPVNFTSIRALARALSNPTVAGLATPPDWLPRTIAIASPDNKSAGLLALLDDGTVQAWYDPNSGGPQEIYTGIPPDLDQVVAISAGNAHAIALESDGTVVAWGKPESPPTKVPPDLDQVVAISAGWAHNLALRSDGTVVQWGNTGFGLDQFPKDLTDVVAIAAGGAHCIAQKKDGSFLTWARNDFGQADVPANLGKVVAFKAIAEDSYYLTAEGRLEHRGQYENEIPRTLENIADFHIGRGALAARTRDGAWQFHGTNLNKKRATLQAKGASLLAFTQSSLFALEGNPAKTTLALAPPPGAPPAAAAAAATHDQFQRRYDTRVAAAHRTKVAELNAQYRGAIERSQKTATAKGELSEVLALRTEIESLDALEDGLALRTPLPAGAPASLEKFRATYADQLATLDATRDRAALPLLNAYDKALGALQAKLTRELKIEDALSVKAARTSLREASPFAPGAPGLDTPLRDPAPAPKKSLTRRPSRLPETPPPLPYPPVRPTVPGSIVAWATDSGDPITELPEEIAGLTDIVALDTASDIGIALRANGKVVVWGGIAEARTRIPGDLTDVAHVACGDQFAVALQTNGRIAVWGRDGNHLNVPDRLRGVAAIPVGGAGIYAIRRAGSAVIWGGYPWGSGASDFRETADKANSLVDIAVGHGSGYAVGLRRDGHLKLLNDKMDWIDDETTDRIEDLRGVIAIACKKNNQHTLVLFNTGEVRALGWGSEGQPDFTPVPPDLPRDIDRLAIGRGGGAAHSRSRGWIFFGDNINTERAATNAAGCIDISFTGTRIYGLRP